MPQRPLLIGTLRNGTPTSLETRNEQDARFGEKSGSPVSFTKDRTARTPRIVRAGADTCRGRRTILYSYCIVTSGALSRLLQRTGAHLSFSARRIAMLGFGESAFSFPPRPEHGASASSCSSASFAAILRTLQAWKQVRKNRSEDAGVSFFGVIGRESPN